MEAKITLNDHRLWVIIHQIYDLLSKWEEDVLIKASISGQQFLVLWIMEYLTEVSDNPIIITDLAPILYRSINSISSIIDRMEKNGLVKKVRDLPDRRSIHLKITSKGEELFKKAIKPHRDMIKTLFSSISNEEQQELLSLIKKLKKKANEVLLLSDLNTDPEINNPKKIAHFLDKLNK